MDYNFEKSIIKDIHKKARKTLLELDDTTGNLLPAVIRALEDEFSIQITGFIKDIEYSESLKRDVVHFKYELTLYDGPDYLYNISLNEDNNHENTDDSKKSNSLSSGLYKSSIPDKTY